MGEIELLTRKVETSHWKKEEIYLHAAAKQASFSLDNLYKLASLPIISSTLHNNRGRSPDALSTIGILTVTKLPFSIFALDFDTFLLYFLIVFSTDF
jgi:hypothetical protein